MILYELNIRQLTADGTFKAAAKHIPFLKELGVDTIWLMPIYPIGEQNRKGTLGSYYSIKDYTAVNPEFGTMADLDRFINKAHKAGLKVILDWVANHTARDARWLTEKPQNWYERESDGSAKIPFDWNDTAKLNYDNHQVWEGQIEAMKFWLTKHNIDGFRCDMAMLVPIKFWQEVRAELTKVRPDIFMLAEAEGREFFDSAFDACYGWKQYHDLCDIAQSKCRVWQLRHIMQSIDKIYTPDSLRLTFTSNHDENSWSGSEQERFGDATEVMSSLTFLLPQSLPLIYTGQEYGFNHSFAFFDKDAMPPQKPNQYTEHYRKLCSIFHSNECLQKGSMIEINTNAPDCLYVFSREYDGKKILVIANLSPYTILKDFHIGIYAGEYVDLLNGENITLPEHIFEHCKPWSYQLLSKL